MNHWLGVVAAQTEVDSHMSASDWAIIVLFALAFGLAVWLGLWASRRQQRNAQALASRRGWSYAESDDSLPARLGGWPFDVGIDLGAHHVTQGVHRRRSTIAFQYRFRFRRTHGPGFVALARAAVASRRDLDAGTADIFHGIDLTLGRDGEGSTESHRVRVMVVAMEMPASLPGFLLRIQLPTDVILPGLRSNDLDLGEKLFDDGFLVRAEHPQLARDLLTPANQDLLLRFSPFARGPYRKKGLIAMHNNPAEGFTMWTAGRNLMLVTNGVLGEQGYEKAFDLMADFLDNVPPWVWDVAVGRGGAPGPGATSSGDAPPPPPPVRSTRAGAPDVPLSPSPISDG